ncbi:MAG: hypothetical protein ACK5MT_19120 [Actinomycetales bacterium]
MAASAPLAEQHVFKEPTEPVSLRFTATLILAQFVFFVALLGPAVVGVAIKVNAVVETEAQRAPALALGRVS